MTCISLRTKIEQFREIKIDEVGVLIHKTRNVNVYQKKVVETGIRYARTLIKSNNCKASLTKQCNNITHGASSMWEIPRYKHSSAKDLYDSSTERG